MSVDEANIEKAQPHEFTTFDRGGCTGSRVPETKSRALVMRMVTPCNLGEGLQGLVEAVEVERRKGGTGEG